MKVLLVCHRFPYPPTRGGKIRPFNILKHLGEQGHSVTVASPTRSEQEAEEGKPLADHCDRILSAPISNTIAWARMLLRLPMPTPSSMGYFYSPRLARLIRDDVERTDYDLVFVHCSSVAQYVAHVEDVPRVIDFGDMDSQKWLAYTSFKPFPLSLGYRMEGLKLQRAETDLARAFDLCTCTTAAEVETLDSFGTGTQSAWFPNGVDSDYFSPDGEPYDPDTLSFIGRMDYYPNVECMVAFCRETLPLIRAKHPAVKLLIVGADPAPAVTRLASIPGVTVTGSVPDVRPYVRRSAASIAPLRIARGTQNKILESLAMGVPCVCSDVAARGVDVVPGEHLLTASTPEGFADHCLDLMRDAELRRTQSEAGRNRMLSNHSWSESMRKLDQILATCVPPRPESAAAKT